MSSGDLEPPPVLPIIRRLAIQADFEAADHILADAALRLVGASRAYVHYADELIGRSVVAFAVYTAQSLRFERIGHHPDYARQIDDPRGTGAERALLAPLVYDDEVIGVVTAVRDPHDPPFRPSDQAALDSLANHAAPLFDRFIGRTQIAAPRLAVGTRQFQTAPEPTPERPETTDDGVQRAIRWSCIALMAMTWLAVILALATPST